MKYSIFSLIISIISGIPYTIAMTNPKLSEYQNIAYFPSNMYAIGLGMVTLVVVPSSALALFFAVGERNKGVPLATVFVVLPAIVLVLGSIVIMRKIWPLISA